MKKLSSNIRRLVKRNEILRNYHTTLFPNGSSGKQFLDLSCGTRTDIREIVESTGNVWMGVDQIDFPGVIKADVHHLPFEQSTFDIVYSAASFEHYYNPWQVAGEVKRVLKPGGIFCGLIAFIQPWHGDSYYHFSHLGTRHMLEKLDMEVLDIHAGDIHGVSYLIRQMFPSPFAFVGIGLSLFGDTLKLIRKLVFPAVIRILYLGNKTRTNEKLSFLNDDHLRFAASIVFLSKKKG